MSNKKNKDPYQEALEQYNNTIYNLDYGISTAMKSLFDNGDLSLIDRKVIVIYGFELANNHNTYLSSR